MKGQEKRASGARRLRGAAPALSVPGWLGRRWERGARIPLLLPAGPTGSPSPGACLAPVCSSGVGTGASGVSSFHGISLALAGIWSLGLHAQGSSLKEAWPHSPISQGTPRLTGPWLPVYPVLIILLGRPVNLASPSVCPGSWMWIQRGQVAEAQGLSPHCFFT